MSSDAALPVVVQSRETHLQSANDLFQVKTVATRVRWVNTRMLVASAFARKMIDRVLSVFCLGNAPNTPEEKRQHERFARASFVT